MDGGVADTATCSYTGRLPERKGVSEAFRFPKIALASPDAPPGRVGASARQHLEPAPPKR